MKSNSFGSVIGGLFSCRFFKNTLLKLALVTVVAASGILSPSLKAQPQGEDDTFIMQPEDRLKVSFPGVPELDSEMQVRRDGVLSMPIVGEIVAKGKTPRQLEEELAALYEDQLVSNEVRVVILESHFSYYLEGEVRNPGIIKSFRQLSVLEAIIAAGGVNKTTGKLSSVVVLRRKGDRYERHDLSLKAVLEGKTDEAFILESHDVVSIPERIW